MECASIRHLQVISAADYALDRARTASLPHVLAHFPEWGQVRYHYEADEPIRTYGLGLSAFYWFRWQDAVEHREKRVQLKVAYAAEDSLGEGPVWSVQEQALYWVDIERPCLQRWHPATGAYMVWLLPSLVGSFALRQQGGAVVALRDGLYFFDLDSGQLQNICRPEVGINTRFNDGKCDRHGRFWAGTTDLQFANPIGALYRLDGHGRCQPMRPGLICANGLGWSPDNSTMYLTDSTIGTIFAYDFDSDDGRLHNERIFVQNKQLTPDGLTVDAEGYVWSAQWDGWKIIRYDPQGRVAQEILLPVQRPTSCTFGGATLSTLYITTSAGGLSPTQRAEQPLAGSVLALETAVNGLPDPIFIG